MDFIFNVRKTVAAAAYLCAKSGGVSDLLDLVKELYAADRTALLAWQRSITGDALFSMPCGPVVSRAYNLMRYKVHGSDMDAWKAVFAPCYANQIRMHDIALLDRDPLSAREEDALDGAFVLIQKLRQESPTSRAFIDALHKAFPEWQDPGESSIEIPPERILRYELSEDQIRLTAIESTSADSARAALT